MSQVPHHAVTDRRKNEDTVLVVVSWIIIIIMTETFLSTKVLTALEKIVSLLECTWWIKGRFSAAWQLLHRSLLRLLEQKGSFALVASQVRRQPFFALLQSKDSYCVSNLSGILSSSCRRGGTATVNITMPVEFDLGEQEKVRRKWRKNNRRPIGCMFTRLLLPFPNCTVFQINACS